MIVIETLDSAVHCLFNLHGKEIRARCLYPPAHFIMLEVFSFRVISQQPNDVLAARCTIWAVWWMSKTFMAKLLQK